MDFCHPTYCFRGLGSMTGRASRTMKRSSGAFRFGGEAAWAAISAMHQYAQRRGGEEDRGGLLTTRRFLFSWLPAGTCASKSRWLGGGASLNTLPAHIHSTYPVMSLGEGISRWKHHLCADRRPLTHTFKHHDSEFMLSAREILSASGTWGKFSPVATTEARVLSVFAASKLVAGFFLSSFSCSVIHGRTHLFFVGFSLPHQHCWEVRQQRLIQSCLTSFLSKGCRSPQPERP